MVLRESEQLAYAVSWAVLVSVSLQSQEGGSVPMDMCFCVVVVVVVYTCVHWIELYISWCLGCATVPTQTTIWTN